MPASKADLILHAILHAAPGYRPCMRCRHSWFGPYDSMGWCGNVPPGKPARPVDEMETCGGWHERQDQRET